MDTASLDVDLSVVQGGVHKVALRSRCIYDCKYCIVKNGTNDLQPSKFASEFITRHGFDCSLLLTSGISDDPDEVSIEMIDAVRQLRSDGFTGYIHFKVLPGVSRDLVQVASLYADRLSINIEAPGAERLSFLSPSKDLRNDILRRQGWIRNSETNLRSGQTTQMIVGLGESDAEALQMADMEYRKLGLRRVYYSSYMPSGHRDLPSRSPPAERGRRLYQADSLLRIYGWPREWLASCMDDDGFLISDDPKAIITSERLDGPLDPLEAGYDELLLIPGIGPATARRLIESRSKGMDWKGLASLGVRSRSKEWLRVNGRWQSTWKHWS